VSSDRRAQKRGGTQQSGEGRPLAWFKSIPPDFFSDKPFGKHVEGLSHFSPSSTLEGVV
jgi:hypothetical protein